MLSGEGNENGENATIGLISKKVHFFGQFFVVVLHDYNDKLPETSRLLRLHVLWRTCPTCFFVAFFFSLSVLFTLVVASIAHFLTATTKFHVVPPTKNVSFVFLSRCSSFSPALSLLASRPTFSFSLSLILFLYIPNLRT